MDILCFIVFCANGIKGKKNLVCEKYCQMRKSFMPTKQTVTQPYVNSDIVILYYVYIMLGISKNFVNTMNKNDARFHFLKETFVHVNNVNINEGISVTLPLNTHIIVYLITDWRSRKIIKPRNWPWNWKCYTCRYLFSEITKYHISMI